MREFIRLDHSRTQTPLESGGEARLRQTQNFIASRSQLLWGEHYAEGVAPACYAACDFYTPRGDGHIEGLTLRPKVRELIAELDARELSRAAR